MKILGIDPGYAILGCGVLTYRNNQFHVNAYGAITTPAEMEFSKRLRKLFEETKALIERQKPDAIAVEELFFNTNTTTAIKVAEARGVVLLAAELCDVEVFEYTPLQVKQAVVGYGRATKTQVMEMTRVLLSLEKAPKPDDVCDALAIAICHGHNSGSLLSPANLRKKYNVK